MKLSNIKSNPNNPRFIKDEKFQKLVKSLFDFPEMMAKRPMVCVTDTDGILYPLGGNMRLKALQELKYKEIPDEWVTIADDWTDEQRKEFTIKDNVGFGEWDWDILANEWDSEELKEWGLDLPGFENVDYSDKNKEIDTDEFSDKMQLTFELTNDEFQFIQSELLRVNANKEIALLKVLKYGA